VASSATSFHRSTRQIVFVPCASLVSGRSFAELGGQEFSAVGRGLECRVEPLLESVYRVFGFGDHKLLRLVHTEDAHAELCLGRLPLAVYSVGASSVLLLLCARHADAASSVSWGRKHASMSGRVKRISATSSGALRQELCIITTRSLRLVKALTISFGDRHNGIESFSLGADIFSTLVRVPVKIRYGKATETLACEGFGVCVFCCVCHEWVWQERYRLFTLFSQVTTASEIRFIERVIK